MPLSFRTGVSSLNHRASDLVAERKGVILCASGIHSPVTRQSLSANVKTETPNPVITRFGLQTTGTQKSSDRKTVVDPHHRRSSSRQTTDLTWSAGQARSSERLETFSSYI